MAGWTLDSGQYVSNTQTPRSTCLTTANTLFTFGEGGDLKTIYCPTESDIYVLT